MNLEEYRTLFMVGSLVLILAVAFPWLSVVVPFPRSGEEYSELWLLGPEHQARNYPLIIRAGEDYLVYVGVGNHLGSSAYYVAFVKFRNQSEALLNATSVSTHAGDKPSPLQPLSEYHVFLQDGEIWEVPLVFSFSGISRYGNRCVVSSLIINNVIWNIPKSAMWDVENGGFFFQLFLELWIYDMDLRSFESHNRFVGIWLSFKPS